MDAKEKDIVRKRRRRRKQIAKRRQMISRVTMFGTITLFLLCVCLSFGQRITRKSISTLDQIDEEDAARPQIDVQLLTPNEYSRPEIKLMQIKGIVIHYTGNPGSTGQGNRDYFESLKDTRITKASSHYVIGLDGEIIQCIPTSEISYASNHRNKDTISIEVCHPDENGKFNDKTYNSLVHLVAWICNRTGLTCEDVIRHYDVTEKICPKYYVENGEAWTKLREEIKDKMSELSNM